MNQLSGFDPLKFLDLSGLKNQGDSISKTLLDKISQYILIRTVDMLPTEDVKKTKNPDELFALAQAKIPDFKHKMKLFLADFKEEFDKNI